MIETKFKESELGPIPYDWEESKICDTFLLRSNNTLSRDKLNYYYTDGIRNIHYGDILTIFGPFVTPKCKLPFINSESISNFDHLYNGDIIVADTAEDETVGKATEIVNFAGEKVVAGLHTIVLRPIASFAPIFLGYLFNSNYYHKALIPHMQGTKVTSISKKAILSTSICFPPSISEQERIAEALSDVDALIKELDALIEKKRMVLKATMQDLLTARRRLPGFSEPWQEVKLGELVNMNSGGTPSTSNHSYYSGIIPFLSISDISSAGKFLYKTQKHISDDAVLNSSARVFPKDTLLISMYASIGKCIISKIDVAISQAILGFVPKKNDFNTDYLYYTLLFNNKELISSGQTGTQSNLNKRIVQNFSVSIPSDIAEQTAISDIFSDMDAEIAELEKKKEKYTSIRQGMMQQLLTGKIRLI